MPAVVAYGEAVTAVDGDLLTIGAFARASRLSPKALRLYDDLGLLRPARVDPLSGYRFYAEDQLERARLVAWLRRLGMPLARIRTVCDLTPAEAAADIAAYWAGVEADTVARRDLAAFLIDQLRGRDPAMTHGTITGIRYAALSDTGLVREGNQDTAYADSRLLAVADGFGADGAAAGTAAIEALRGLGDGPDPLPGDILNTLSEAVGRANRAVAERGAGEDSGTTLTAMLWTGSRLALVHVGDSRAYLLRDGCFFRITHDHTLVQSLVDEGRLTLEEAAAHPQRSLLLRALDGRDGERSVPDVKLPDARPGDRYLLCSDGLYGVVRDADLRGVLASGGTPEQAVRDLIELARAAGAPDNVSCVVADTLPAAA
ncbi:MerR family transcriptional regulator [Streptomyces niger]|uniref:MerR family transcriptional regulator n=1 Tax=Streptomyces niger TaxID=66373 RepID=UPI000AB9E5D7|nr:MerR family transcriptional regulator [Streptomyces niger]